MKVEVLPKPKTTQAFGRMWANRKHNRAEVTLECGHSYTVTNRKDREYKTMVCEKCADADGVYEW